MSGRCGFHAPVPDKMHFSHASPVDAWQAVVAHLRANGDVFGVLVSFQATLADEAKMAVFDPRRFGVRHDRISDVANTIFPLKTRLNSVSRPDFYARYLKAHSRCRRQSWGTYFERFVAFGDTRVNQVERVITALTHWKKVPKAALLMHTSSAETDSLKLRGGPCLQYVQFNCPGGNRVDLLAVYRNHDYFNKALGNFFGLARLLHFVCEESGREPGLVTCVSAHAYFDTSKSAMSDLAKLA